MKRFLIPVFVGLCVAGVFLTWELLDGGSPGCAAEAETAEPPGYRPDSDLPGLALRVTLGLGLILVLIVGAVYTLRVVGVRSGVQSNKQVKVLDRCYLAPKRALYMVRMGARVVVVGVTDTTITPVLELSPEERESLYPEGVGTPEPGSGFSGILKDMAGKIVRARS